MFTSFMLPISLSRNIHIVVNDFIEIYKKKPFTQLRKIESNSR